MYKQRATSASITTLKRYLYYIIQHESNNNIHSINICIILYGVRIQGIRAQFTNSYKREWKYVIHDCLCLKANDKNNNFGKFAQNECTFTNSFHIMMRVILNKCNYFPCTLCICAIAWGIHPCILLQATQYCLIVFINFRHHHQQSADL